MSLLQPERGGPMLTPANAAEDRRVAPVDDAPQGWSPSNTRALIASIAVGLFMSVGAVIALPGLTLPVLLGSAMTGIATGVGTFFGMKSSGMHKDA